MTQIFSGIPSPCINVCRISQQTGYCEGCWRNLEEIGAWSQASDTYKQAVWQQIELRKAQQDHG